MRATFDHVIPVCRGGDSWPENMVLSCHRCNSEKGDMPAEDFIPSKLHGPPMPI